MTRQEALQEVQKHVKNKNLINHMVAAEAVMEAIAIDRGLAVEDFALAGLLHDIDYDQTDKDPASHSIVAAGMLRDLGLTEEIIHAVKCHNDYHRFERESFMDKALYCTDPVTGLIVAGALIHPDKKLSSIDTDFMVRKFHTKQFAKGANREKILTCTELGYTLEEFLSLALTAMTGYADRLGL